MCSDDKVRHGNKGEEMCLEEGILSEKTSSDLQQSKNGSTTIRSVVGIFGRCTSHPNHHSGFMTTSSAAALHDVSSITTEKIGTESWLVGEVDQTPICGSNNSEKEC